MADQASLRLQLDCLVRALRVGYGLELGEVVVVSGKVVRNKHVMSEKDRLNVIMERIWPREPHIRIYRINPDTKKHTFLGTAEIEGFDLHVVQEWYGAGTYLLRAVRSDGKYGPSRVVRIASAPVKHQ